MVYVFVQTKFLYCAQFPTHSGYSRNICWAGECQLPLHPFVAIPLLYLSNYRVSPKMRPTRTINSNVFFGAKFSAGNWLHRCQKSWEDKKRGWEGNPKVNSSRKSHPYTGGAKGGSGVTTARGLGVPDRTWNYRGRCDGHWQQGGYYQGGTKGREGSEKYSGFSFPSVLQFLIGKPCRMPTDMGT